MKNRNKQRENRKKKSQDDKLYRVNSFGVRDLTAYNALRRYEIGKKMPIILG